MGIIKKTLKKVNKSVVPRKSFFAPQDIVLGVNNVCNLHCKMCDVGTQNLDSNFAQNLVGTTPLNMPLELAIKAIDETAIHFPKAKLAYAFTEPLVYPHLAETLLHAKKKGVSTTLTTNALTLKQKANAILDGELAELNVSLDGPQDIHNEIRGHKKSFQKALEGIEILKSHEKCPKITVICAITEWNAGYLQKLIQDLEGYNIDEFAFMHTQFNSEKAAVIHNSGEWGDLYPATDSNVDLINFENLDLPLLVSEIKEINAMEIAANIYFSPEMTTEDELRTYYLEPEKIIGKHCSAVYNSIMIKSDGSVIPAHGRCYNLTIGNLHNSNLKDIWKSGVLEKLRADLHTAGGLFPGCSRCCSAF